MRMVAAPVDDGNVRTVVFNAIALASYRNPRLVGSII
jgi:hypothetical protein